MVNFGPLAAAIVSLVWGTPGNFNGFCVLAALLHGTLVHFCFFSTSQEIAWEEHIQNDLHGFPWQSSG